MPAMTPPLPPSFIRCDPVCEGSDGGGEDAATTSDGGNGDRWGGAGVGGVGGEGKRSGDGNAGGVGGGDRGGGGYKRAPQSMQSVPH